MARVDLVGAEVTHVQVGDGGGVGRLTRRWKGRVSSIGGVRETSGRLDVGVAGASDFVIPSVSCFVAGWSEPARAAPVRGVCCGD